MQGRTPPALPLRCEGHTLRGRTDAQAIALRIVHRAGIDRRTAIAAEGVKAFVAAFGHLHIGLRSAAEDNEMLGRRRMLMRKAEPESVWQSVQWQMVSPSGSTAASKVISPQWQCPSIFMHLLP